MKARGFDGVLPMMKHQCMAISLAALILVPASVAAWSQTPETGPNAAGSLDAGQLNRARARWLKDNKAAEVHYTTTFDLSGLPDYKPERQVSGTIRQWGSNYLADSMLETYLEEGFRKYQPGVAFKNTLKSTFIAMGGLYSGMADLAPMGRRATSDELQGYQRIFDSAPVEVAMASGSYDVAGWTFALVVFVNKDNPIGKLTLDQLDGIFGAERTGGSHGNSWDPSAARGPEKNIRSWGQLGLTGAWADKPIHVYGYNLNYHFPQEFAEVVFKGGNKWNETLKEYTNQAKPDGSGLISAGTQLAAEVSQDPYGITYTGIQYRTAQVKPVALAAGAQGPYVAPTLESVQDRSYPLSREVYYYVNRMPGKEIDPVQKEFLRFVLSRQGQEAVQKDGKYLPLTADIVRAQLKKLDEVGTPGKSAE
jgi:phosphate transport system substrate-binding protein